MPPPPQNICHFERSKAKSRNLRTSGTFHVQSVPRSLDYTRDDMDFKQANPYGAGGACNAQMLFLWISPKILHKKPFLFPQNFMEHRNPGSVLWKFHDLPIWLHDHKTISFDPINARISKISGYFSIFRDFIAFSRKNYSKSTGFLHFVIVFEQYVN